MQLDGVSYPHDFAFGTLPSEHSNGSTPVVIYVTETPPADTTPAKLHRFVLHPEGDGWSREALRPPLDTLPQFGNMRSAPERMRSDDKADDSRQGSVEQQGAEQRGPEDGKQGGSEAGGRTHHAPADSTAVPANAHGDAIQRSESDDPGSVHSVDYSGQMSNSPAAQQYAGGGNELLQQVVAGSLLLAAVAGALHYRFVGMPRAARHNAAAYVAVSNGVDRPH